MHHDKSEFVEFGVSKDIIPHLIRSQNGTPETSLRELLINALDATASTVNCTVGHKKFNIEDNGVGFESKEHIMTCFAVFGTGHKDSDLPTHGRFRIGRGQIMALAKVEWHSGPHKMRVNLDEKESTGYGFHYSYDEEDTFKGCKVSGEFFSPINSYHLHETIDALKNLVKYVPQSSITINGDSVGMPPAINWDYEDDDILIRYYPDVDDCVQIYSQGVHVQDFQYHHFGFSADVISKSAMPLNMARNSIRREDPVFKKITDILNKKAIAVAKEKEADNRLDEGARRAMIRRLLQGQIDLSDTYRMRLVKDCRGKTSTWGNILGTSRPLTHTPDKKSRIAERVASTKGAVVLHFDELRVWGVETTQDFIDKFASMAIRDNKTWLLDKVKALRVVDFDTIAKNYNTTLSFLPDKELNKQERAARNALQRGCKIMAERLNNAMDYDIVPRKLMVGVSDSSLAWTDGVTFIAIERSQLALFDRGVYGAVQLSALLLAKYMTDINDSEMVNHDFSYYQNYLEAILHPQGQQEVLGHVAESMLTTYDADKKRRGIIDKKKDKHVVQQFRSSMHNKVVGNGEHARISPFMRNFLRELPISVSSSKKGWSLSLGTGRNDDYKLNRAIADLRNKVREHTGFNEDGGYFSDRKPGYQERLRAACMTYGKEGGVNGAVVAALVCENNIEEQMLPYMGGNLHRVATALCTDPDSGMSSFTCYYYGRTFYGAKDTFILNEVLSANSYSRWNDGDDTNLATPDKRKDAILKHMRCILQGLPRDDRDSLIETLFSEDGKILMS